MTNWQNTSMHSTLAATSAITQPFLVSTLTFQMFNRYKINLNCTLTSRPYVERKLSYLIIIGSAEVEKVQSIEELKEQF